MANVQDKVSEQIATAVGHAREAAESVSSKVTDFFQGNPFDSPIGRKIEMATDATKLSTENWGLNMEICDFINYTNEGGRDAMRAIRKRLQTQMGKNNAIIMYTLTVLETAVKNCDQRFVALVCQKEFVNELVKLIGVKYDAPQIIQERILGLIQSWADAFRHNPACSGVVEVYDELKAKGVEFPAKDLDALAPIITPKRTVYTSDQQNKTPSPKTPNKKNDEISASQQTPRNPTPPRDPVIASLELEQQPPPQQQNVQVQPPLVSAAATGLAPEQMAKLRSELDMVNVNITVFRELCGALKPSKPDGSESSNTSVDLQLIQELNMTCREMQKRILELIPAITNEEITCELLSVNDELNSVFEKYERCMATRGDASPPFGGKFPAGESEKTNKISTPSGAENLIDLGGGGSSASAATDLKQPKKQPSVESIGKQQQQFQPIDLRGKEQSSSKATTENAPYITDQAAVGLRTAAFDKTEPVEERHQNNQQGKGQKNSSPTKEEDGNNEWQKFDDGL